MTSEKIGVGVSGQVLNSGILYPCAGGRLALISLFEIAV